MSGSALGHDPEPDVTDRAATSALSDALSRLQLQGAIFLRGEYSEAWAYESLPSKDAAMVLAPGAERVVLFHVVAKGRCWIQAEGGERLWAQAGDVIVLPYNDQHRMGGSMDAECVPIGTLITPPPWDAMPIIQHGEGGPATSVVCGYLACEAALFDPRMRIFPPAFVVSPPDGPARTWVTASIEYAAQQTTQVAEDRFESATQVPELLLVEVLKLHLATAPAAEDGWVAAINDPVLAPTLAAIHGSPEQKWTVEALAGLAGVSVSLLDERFRRVLGLAPIRYLTGWRMHVAEDLLRSTDLGIAVVARRIGYDSEEAFSRAFKRVHGDAPSVWRVQRPQ
jgi:AraC-like DNA-binding protein